MDDDGEGAAPVKQKGRVHEASLQLDMTPSASFTATVKRGKDSWNYIYIVLGFALTIETGVVALITPLKWPWNLVTLAVVAGATGYLFLNNGWFQNKLIGLKIRHEEKHR